MLALLLATGFVLAGETIEFDAELRPRFTEKQVRETAASTRAGLAKWAATDEGKAIIARFRVSDREVVVTESDEEPSIGRAPQPGFLTFLAAEDRTKHKTYQLVVNPTLAAQYNTKTSLDLGLPQTPADVMALAWAGEMLHIDFYAKGITLPHHERVDFQERWQLVVSAMGMPRVDHATDRAEDALQRDP